MKTIGFAGTFYTLWEVSKPYKLYINKHTFYMAVDYHYFKNISIDLERAKEKMGDSDYNIDLNLKGNSSWTEGNKEDTIFDRSKVDDFIIPMDLKGAGRDIRKMGLNDEASINRDSIKILWSMYLKKDIGIIKF